MSATSPAPKTANDTFEQAIDFTLLVSVATAAAVFSWHNVLQLAETHGQKDWLAWVIAGCIETTAIKGGLEYRRRHRLGQPVAFAVALVAVAAGLQLAAQVAEVDLRFGAWGYILAAVPAATFLILVKLAVSRSGTPAGSLAAAIERAAAAERAAQQAAEERAAAVAVAEREIAAARQEAADEVRRREAVEALLAAEKTRRPVGDQPPVNPKGEKVAPTREEARAILMDLRDFEAEPNAKLSREHGGSDTFWRQRKDALRRRTVLPMRL